MLQVNFILNKKGTKIAVQIPIKKYEKLLANSEELDEIKENRKNKSLKSEAIPHLASSLGIQDTALTDEMVKLAVIKLYELGKISSSKAAKTIGINRISFLDLLGNYRVSIFNDTESLLEDMKNA